MPTEPIRLLVFAHALQGRGTEKAVVRLLSGFDRAKILPILAIASARGEFLSAVPIDIPVHDLGIGDRKTSRAIPRLQQLIQRSKPDCALGVHISAGRVLCALRFIHPRLPVICMEADPFTRIEGEKGNLGLRKIASRITYKLATHIVAASEVVADDLVEHLKVPPSKISLIPLPSVDAEMSEMALEPLSDPPFGPGQADPVIVTIGNMFPHKDQTTLIEAFARVTAELPANLVLIGEGPLRSELEDLAQRSNVADRVFFTGFQPNPYRYLARSSVFVSSSLAEGFDISQIEAMAMGLPVVVTDAPRFEAIEDGRTGLAVPPSDPSALAQAMLGILRSDALASRLGANARTAAQQYTSVKIALRYEELIRAITSGFDPPGLGPSIRPPSSQ